MRPAPFLSAAAAEWQHRAGAGRGSAYSKGTATAHAVLCSAHTEGRPYQVLGFLRQVGLLLGVALLQQRLRKERAAVFGRSGTRPQRSLRAPSQSRDGVKGSDSAREAPPPRPQRYTGIPVPTPGSPSWKQVLTSSPPAHAGRPRGHAPAGPRSRMPRTQPTGALRCCPTRTRAQRPMPVTASAEGPTRLGQRGSSWTWAPVSWSWSSADRQTPPSQFPG